MKWAICEAGILRPIDCAWSKQLFLSATVINVTDDQHNAHTIQPRVGFHYPNRLFVGATLPFHY